MLSGPTCQVRDFRRSAGQDATGGEEFAADRGTTWASISNGV